MGHVFLTSRRALLQVARSTTGSNESVPNDQRLIHVLQSGGRILSVENYSVGAAVRKRF